MHNIWGMIPLIPLIPYTHVARNASSPNSSSTLDDVIVGHICEEDTENVPATNRFLVCAVTLETHTAPECAT